MENFVGININYLEEPMVPIRYLIKKVRDSRRRNIKKAHSIAKLRVKINLVRLRYLRGGLLRWHFPRRMTRTAYIGLKTDKAKKKS